MLACAMTGSGKTAAFLLPILHQLKDKPRGVTRVLVLAPTRELAAQIVEHMQGLAKHTGIKGAAVFGGVAMGPQEKAFRKGVDVLVATPGRLLDHFQNDYAKLEGLEILVLDEADRMLDMGFLPDCPARAPAPAARAPDPVLLGHPAAAHRRAGRRDAQEPREPERRAQVRAGAWHHAGGLSRPGGAQALLPGRAAAPRRDQERPGLHPHQAPGEPAGRLPGPPRRLLRPHPRQPQPDPAHGRPHPLQGRGPPGPGGDRHRRPRDRRRGPLARHQLRRPQHSRGLHPPGRPHRPRRDGGGRLHLRLGPGAGRAERHRAGGGPAAAAPHPAGLRLHGPAHRAFRDPDPGAHRRHPRPPRRGARPRQGQGRAQGPAPGGGEGQDRREGATQGRAARRRPAAAATPPAAAPPFARPPFARPPAARPATAGPAAAGPAARGRGRTAAGSGETSSRRPASGPGRQAAAAASRRAWSP